MEASTFRSFNLPSSIKVSSNQFQANQVIKPATYKFRIRRVLTLTVCSCHNKDATLPGAAATGTTTPVQGTYNVEFKTQGGCKLGIWRYPIFEYNANGGTGNGTGREKNIGGTNDIIDLQFDVGSLYIPSLNGETTKFLGLPLPPFLRIDIVPEILQGSIDRKSGKVDLQFKSRFWFSVGSIYKAPALLVQTVLTSEESAGTIRSGTGERMDEEGRCKLVGVAVVDPIDDALMNNFLRLPTECIAYLNAVIAIKPS